MYQNDAEMLFPARVIPQLEDLRGEPWRKLVTEVAALPETDPVEVEGIQFAVTCQCIGLLTLLNTICIGVTCSG